MAAGIILRSLAPVIRALIAAALLAGAGTAQEMDILPPSAPVRGGMVSVGTGDAVPIGQSGRRLVRVAFPRIGTGPAAGPVVGPKKSGTAFESVNALHAAGRAAGNAGDLYENRDRAHSSLRMEDFPQLAHVRFADTARRANLDYGLADTLVYDAPVIGNSSTALTSGRLWRSLPRLALTRDGTPSAMRLFQNYALGQIHVYPEHRDHDPERGDLLPANTPYMIVSQGSSGSDRAHLEALVMIYAAYRPETKAFLRESGLLASTTQMVFRRAMMRVRSRDAYLSGLAHPSVFDGDHLNLALKVRLANSIAPDSVPPMVLLDVISETPAREGADYFGADLDERLFDTPSAIARVWRSRAGRREMIVSAGATQDPNGRPLAFSWSVLRGDPARTRVEPLPPDGRRARITVDWQEPRPVAGAPEIASHQILSHRVDIGVFADNGVHISAPAFVSILLPRHETRVYETGPDGRPEVVSIDRDAGGGAYADPLLFPRMAWRDVYDRDADGRITGWTRHRRQGVTRYESDGLRLDEDGGRTPVVYDLKRAESGLTRIEERAMSDSAH